MSSPLLSVCLITYNHEKYIREAIDGVLMQETNFNWQLVIADDCSTDNTRNILLEYKQKYPDIITLILQEKNVGPAQNYVSLLSYPKSKYIAYFEGDDYWTDCKKIQKQVDCLEANPELAACFHSFSILNEGTGEVTHVKHPLLYKKDTFETKDCIDHWFLQSATLVFKQEVLTNLPKFFLTYSNDVALLILISLFGKIKYLNFDMSMYRNHIASVTKIRHNYEQQKQQLETRIKALNELNEYTAFKYKKEIEKHIHRISWYFEVTNSKNGFDRFNIFVNHVTKFDFFEKNNIKSNLGLLFPGIYKLYSKIKN